MDFRKERDIGVCHTLQGVKDFIETKVWRKFRR